MSDLHLTSSHAPPLPTDVTVSGTAVLLTISGPDRPGVSRAFFSGLATLPILVLDVEQVVTSGQLILASLIVPDPHQHQDVTTDVEATLHAIESTATAGGREARRGAHPRLRTTTAHRTPLPPPNAPT